MSKNNKKVYFISDIHLGSGGFENSRKREKLVIKWLDEIKINAQSIYLLGDIFDFWHEWQRCAPQGFTRFIGRLGELSDSGIDLHFFTGNHDIWMYDYLKREIGFKLYRHEIETEIMGKKFYLAHGDGLGPNDYTYKFLKKIFTNKILQWCFKHLLHPDLALKLAHKWSNSRKLYSAEPINYGEEEWLTIHARNILKTKHFDYFIFGHRHLPHVLELKPESKLINLGDWLQNFTYGVFDGNNFELKTYPHNNLKISSKK